METEPGHCSWVLLAPEQRWLSTCGGSEPNGADIQRAIPCGKPINKRFLFFGWSLARLRWLVGCGLTTLFSGPKGDIDPKHLKRWDVHVKMPKVREDIADDSDVQEVPSPPLKRKFQIESSDDEAEQTPIRPAKSRKVDDGMWARAPDSPFSNLFGCQISSHPPSSFLGIASVHSRLFKSLKPASPLPLPAHRHLLPVGVSAAAPPMR